MRGFYDTDPDECCGTCRFHRNDGHDWICTNEVSCCYGCYTEYTDSCEEYDKRQPRNGPANFE
ncbi:MAG: hypothetical protein SOI56_06630 [Eubacteriales bacterium]|jgi:hypothetical protein